MKKIVSLFLLFLMLTPALVMAKKDDQGLVTEYQLEGAGMTSDNAQQVKISILSKKKDVSDAQLEASAVHGILFRDYDDATNSGYGSVASHKCLMGTPTAEAQHIDFFEPFFKNGDYAKYVQLVSDSRRVVKVGKQYKVSAIVRVNSTQLRKDLKKQGLAKDLGSGW